MKKSMFLAACLLFSGAANSQTITVQDDLNWVPTSVENNIPSPNFDFCGPTGEVSYTISSSTANFTFNGGGLYMPASSGSNFGTVPITLTFSQPVSNLRIKLVDIDEGVSNAEPDSEETVTGISPTYNNMFATVGTWNALGAPGTGITALDAVPGSNNNNTSGWVEWNVTDNVYSFTYNRPGSGYGLILDSIVFDCTEACPCPGDARIESGTLATAEGALTSNLSVNSGGEAVTSLTLELPYFNSLADPNCMACSNEVEKFGTFGSVPTIAGVAGVVMDPYGTGEGSVRKIRYDFATPTILNENVVLELQFPPVHELECCPNRVNYCIDVLMRKEDCTVCEYTACNTELPQEEGKGTEKKERSAAPKMLPEMVDGNIDELGLAVSPNPATSVIRGKVNDENFTSGEVFLYGPNGRLIQKQTLNSNEFSLQLENTVSGVHLVTVVGNGKRSTTQVVVK